MKRLDFCKKEIAKKINEEKPLNVIYQELNNMLPTYKEKKALQDYLVELNYVK
jgi:hypothetical protein